MNDFQESQNRDRGDDPQILECSIPEAARRLGISKATVRRRIKGGALAAKREGKQWVVLLPNAVPMTQAEAERIESISSPLSPRRQRRSRPFFWWLAIALVISVVVIEAALTVVLLRGDTVSQSGAAPIVLPTSAVAASTAPVVATSGAPLTAVLATPSREPEQTPTEARAAEIRSRPTVVRTAAASATLEAAQSQSASPPPAPADGRDRLTGIALEVAAAEVKLQSGQFDAVLDYGNGVRSASHASFDLGDGQREPRIHLTTTYTNADTIQNSEQILIGERAWHREANGRWVPLAEQEGMWGQLQSFLPHVLAATNPEITRGEQAMTLRWYDARDDADVTLEVDPATGTPRRLQRTNRTNSQTLTVIYSGWNTPVEIEAPSEQ